MMMLKSVCLVYIVVFASLGRANVTEDNIDGYDVVDNKTGNTDDVVIKKDGTTLTVQITNSEKNYTVFKVNDTDTCIVAFGDFNIKDCTEGTEPAPHSVPKDIQKACGDKKVVYMTNKDCQDENRRMKRAVRCYYYYFMIRTYCSSGGRCNVCIRTIRVRVCFNFSG